MRQAIDGHTSLGAKGGQIFDRSGLAQILQASGRPEEAREQLAVARQLDEQVTRNSGLDLMSSRIFRRSGELRDAFEALAAEQGVPSSDLFYRLELGLLAQAAGLPAVAGPLLASAKASLDDRQEALGAISAAEFETAMAEIEGAMEGPIPIEEWLDPSTDWADAAETALRAVDERTRPT